jgi:hypothetical protein
MNDVGTLRSLGFTAAEARHLQTLKRRYQRGDFHEALTLKELRRLDFIRWLIRQGRLSR